VPVTLTTPRIAHQAVENTRRLDSARERGKVHNDPPQDFTFDDFLDIINPLHHLPIVSFIYRAISGDEIKPAMRILGGIAYGGPSGFMSSCAQVLFEAIFGDDLGGTAIALITGEDKDKTKREKTAEAAAGPAAQLAATDPSAPPSSLRADAAAAYAALTRDRGSHR
jgi:hypothetical protein